MPFHRSRNTSSARTPWHQGLCLLAWLSVAQPAGAAPAESWLALVTKVEGTVALAAEGRSTAVAAYTRLPLGALLDFEAGASLEALCVNGRLCRLGKSGPLTSAYCRCREARGVGVESAAVEPRLRLGSVTWTGATRRGPEDLLAIPMLVAPRCPQELSEKLGCEARLEAPKAIRWLEVEGQGDYRLALSGGGGRGFPYRDVHLEADRVTCTPMSAHAGRRACEIPWPEAWALETGRSYRLEVLAPGEGEIVSSGETRLSLVNDERAESVRKILLGLPPTRLEDPAWVHSLIYSGFGLVNEAARLLESVDVEARTPLQGIALGMAYRRLDAPEQAAWIFKEEGSQGGAPQALADLHYGLTLGELGRGYEAMEKLGAARSWYRDRGPVSAEVEALRALSRVYRRLGEERRAEELATEARTLGRGEQR